MKNRDYLLVLLKDARIRSSDLKNLQASNRPTRENGGASCRVSVSAIHSVFWFVSNRSPLATTERKKKDRDDCVAHCTRNRGGCQSTKLSG
jgi:hypothetical protein